MSDRYHVEGSQTAYQPGSDDRVLANRLGIIVPEEMAEAELILLEKLYNAILLQDFPDRALTVADLKTWHRRWLGNIYDWAGEERSVNLSKDEFPFAAAVVVSVGSVGTMIVRPGIDLSQARSSIEWWVGPSSP